MPSTTKQLFNNVHGRAFAPDKEAREKYAALGFPLYFGKEKWQEAGLPDDCIVYDYVDALLSMNMPLLDTVRTQAGLWFRRKPLIKPAPYAEPRRLFPDRVNDTGEINVLSLRDTTLEAIPNRVSVIREDIVARKGSISRGVAKRAKPQGKPTP